MKISKSIKSALAVTATSVALLGIGITSASAQSDHAITGTAYSNGTTYISANARYKTSGSTYVYASFVSLPKNGLYFYLISASNGLIGTPQAWGQNETAISKTLAGGVKINTRFYNAFRLASACSGGCSPYNFIGSERY